MKKYEKYMTNEQFIDWVTNRHIFDIAQGIAVYHNIQDDIVLIVFCQPSKYPKRGSCSDKLWHDIEIVSCMPGYIDCEYYRPDDTSAMIQDIDYWIDRFNFEKLRRKCAKKNFIYNFKYINLDVDPDDVDDDDDDEEE